MTKPAPLTLHIVTGIQEAAVSMATMQVQWESANAVVLRHDIDAQASMLHRTVSDVTGILDQESISLAHACISCAIREDIVPMIKTLADLGRWDAIVVRLPVAAAPAQICRVVQFDEELRHKVRVRSVVAALDGSCATDDLTGDETLIERNLHGNHGDHRGVAESATALVEYADVVSIFNPIAAAELEFVEAIARPNALVTQGWTEQASAAIQAGRHVTAESDAFTQGVTMPVVSDRITEHTWTWQLNTERPLHPQRLHDNIERLGGGWFRSRGVFWLPTRPQYVVCWDSAGGQLSIGTVDSWSGQPAKTHITFTGLVSRGDNLSDLRAAFEETLLTEEEMTRLWEFSEAPKDGLEPWLGTIAPHSIMEESYEGP